VPDAGPGLERDSTDGFSEGRALIERAFVDRLLPLLQGRSA
jgi:hypothetical protein